MRGRQSSQGCQLYHVKLLKLPLNWVKTQRRKTFQQTLLVRICQSLGCEIISINLAVLPLYRVRDFWQALRGRLFLPPLCLSNSTTTMGGMGNHLHPLILRLIIYDIQFRGGARVLACLTMAGMMVRQLVSGVEIRHYSSLKLQYKQRQNT